MAHYHSVKDELLVSIKMAYKFRTLMGSSTLVTVKKKNIKNVTLWHKIEGRHIIDRCDAFETINKKIGRGDA